MLEAGTLNVPGIAGLEAGLKWLEKTGIEKIEKTEEKVAKYSAEVLKKMGFCVFSGEHQSGTVSFTGQTDCEQLAQKLAQKGIAVRAGLHCAPLAHQTAGTLQTGTVRLSFGYRSSVKQAQEFLNILQSIK